MKQTDEKRRNREQKCIGRVVGTSLISVALVLLCIVGPSALAAQISVEPLCQIVPQDGYFSVNISVNPGGNETYAASYTLYFNSTLLNATSQANGSFLSQDGVDTFELKNEINNTLGEIKYGECRTGDSGVTNPDVLATITFQAIAVGFCELGITDLDGVILADPNYTSIPTDANNGSVRIGICGDVDNSGGMTTGDAIQIFNNILHGPGQYPINNHWAADVDGGGEMTTGDAIQIFNNILHGPEQYPLNCRCP